MPKRKQFDSKEVAKWLEMRKANNHSTVLLLGARAGGLFRSEHFYENLQKFSHRDFRKLSLEEQFRECYAVLTRNQFSETDIHTILKTSLQDLTITRADVFIAALVKDKYFDEIISTNIDDMLERSFTQVEMKEQREFEIFVPAHKTFHEKITSCRIIKVFGEFASRTYTIEGRPFYLDSRQEIKNSLQRLLARDILAIGLDPVWDEDLIRAIPLEKAGSIFFVNEEDYKDHVLLSALLRERQAQCILSRYDSFIRELYDHLYGDRLPINYQLGRDILTQLDDIANKQRVLQDRHKDILKEIQDTRENVLNEIKELRSEIAKLALLWQRPPHF